jgi:hypothetical protein
MIPRFPSSSSGKMKDHRSHNVRSLSINAVNRACGFVIAGLSAAFSGSRSQSFQVGPSVKVDLPLYLLLPYSTSLTLVYRKQTLGPKKQLHVQYLYSIFSIHIPHNGQDLSSSHFSTRARTSLHPRHLLMVRTGSP